MQCYDYLNDVLMLYSSRKRDGTYRKAMALKRKGDAVIFNNLCREWISRFKWTVTAKDAAIDTNLIERAILFDGMAAFRRISREELFSKRFFEFGKESSELKWRLFRVSGNDNLSFYGYPNRANLTDFSGVSYGASLVLEDDDDLTEKKEISEKMCVLVYDSVLSAPPFLSVLYYAEKLSIIEASINACIQNIMGTTVIVCSKEQEKQILKERNAARVGVPWVVRYDELYKSGENINLMNTPGASEELKTLYEAYNKIHADFLQSIGIRANNEVDKKSGVTPIELIQSRQNVDLILNNALGMRKKAIKQLKIMGLEGVEVDLDNFDSIVADYDANGNKINKVDNKPQKEKEGGEEE